MLIKLKWEIKTAGKVHREILMTSVVDMLIIVSEKVKKLGWTNQSN